MFLKLAIEKTGESNMRCPCIKCQNRRRNTEEVIEEHLVIFGMDLTYTNWIWHGESLNSVKSGLNAQDKQEMCSDAYLHDDFFPNTVEEETNSEFIEFLEKVELPLYPGCTKYTMLSATVLLYKLKVMYGLSNQGFDGFLAAFKNMLPEGNMLPDSSYSVDSVMKEFQLGEKKIHACVNGCYLFTKELEKSDHCPKCKFSRWEVDHRTKEIKVGRPAKVLRYFPIIPRFKRMFQSPHLAEQLMWHHNNKSKDGNMRHPVDSEAWELIDTKWPEFSMEPRNLRLGLAADGINPFSSLSSTYSCWPVMLVTYNLPPWLCMRKEHLMLALLIPGPKQPGNDIDVFLRPLIEDLYELWDKGAEAYDSYTKNMFNLKAILMWTINDFPAFGNLSGCITKGKFACPTCGKHTLSIYLPNWRKTVYLGHRCFLPRRHSFRSKRRWFNGKREDGEKPTILSGSEIMDELKNIENDFGKQLKRKRGQPKNQISPKVWKKKSIFFYLPYWEVRDIFNLIYRFYIKIVLSYFANM